MVQNAERRCHVNRAMEKLPAGSTKPMRHDGSIEHSGGQRDMGKTYARESRCDDQVKPRCQGKRAMANLQPIISSPANRVHTPSPG